MPRYPEGFSEGEYLFLREVVGEVGSNGPFDANQLLAAYMAKSMSRPGAQLVNAGSVAQILDDLCDLEVLRRIDTNPPRWETVDR